MREIDDSPAFGIAELSGTILSGAPSGRQLYARWVEALPEEPIDACPIFLDFSGVEVATASFLRESVLAFRTFVRGRKSNYYPVVANATSDVIDELVELVQPRGDVLMTCTVGDDGKVLRWRLVGKLEPMQQLAFDLVNRHGETTVNKLMQIDKSSVKATAWNNRLAALSGLGIVCEKTQGRTKSYRAIFAGGSNGR